METYNEDEWERAGDYFLFLIMGALSLDREKREEARLAIKEKHPELYEELCEGIIALTTMKKFISQAIYLKQIERVREENASKKESEKRLI